MLAEETSSSTSSREKIRGSPRFPHRIMPANSLGAIASGQLNTAGTPHRWHSMEDSWKPRMQTTPRGSSCSPNFDVWAAQEIGIPLSELVGTSHGKRAPTSDLQSLTIRADSDISPDDSKLGSDLRKLFRENSIGTLYG